MTRPLRTNSGTGIYHVMLRGINKQIIFESPLDYGKFLNLLYQTVRILDFDKSKYTVTDQDVSEFIINNYGLHQPSDLQLYDKVRRNDILKSARDFGASIRQLARLTGISVGIIRNI